MNDDKGSWVAAKVLAFAALFGISTWSEAAAFVSFIGAGSMLTRFYWVHVWRPFFERVGWIKVKTQKRRRKADKDDSGMGML